MDSIDCLGDRSCMKAVIAGAKDNHLFAHLAIQNGTLYGIIIKGGP